MEISLILSAEPLTLAGELKLGQPIGEVFTVKNIPARTYLTVSLAQWDVLQLFATPQTVPQVLGRVIDSRHCPRLGEFYELILKARRAGILTAAGQTLPPVFVRDWKSRLSPRLATPFIATLLVAGLALAAWRARELPTTPFEWALSAVLTLGALSVGSIVGGLLLRGGEAEIYGDPLSFSSGLPHFNVVLGDARLLPRRERATTLLAKLAVTAGIAGVLALWHPGWAVLPATAALALLRPFAGGSALEALRLYAGRLTTDAEEAFIFPPNRSPAHRLRVLRQCLTTASVWIQIAYAALWSLIVFGFLNRFLVLTEHRWDFFRDEGPRLAFAAAASLGALIALLLLREIIFAARTRGRSAWIAGRRFIARWFIRREPPAGVEERMSLLAGMALFRGLDHLERGQLAFALTPTRLGPWCRWTGGTAERPEVALIVSGEASIHENLGTRRRVRTLTLGEGDVIGLHNLTDPAQPEGIVRSRTPLVLFHLDRETFERIVLARLGRIQLTNLGLKLPFLMRLPLCAHWHPQAVTRFATLTQFTDYADGSVILAEGYASQFFFIIHTGWAFATHRGRRVGRIGPGEFLGEIGLLQNSVATATVHAAENVRCLCIAKKDFLRFVTHNYAVALTLEHVSSARLGRPIFPLNLGDFAIR